MGEGEAKPTYLRDTEVMLIERVIDQVQALLVRVAELERKCAESEEK